MMPLTGKYLNHTSGAKLLGILAMGMRPVPLGDAYMRQLLLLGYANVCVRRKTPRTNTVIY